MHGLVKPWFGLVWFGLVWFGFFARGLAVVFDLVRFGSGELSYIQNHDVLILMCIYPIYPTQQCFICTCEYVLYKNFADFLRKSAKTFLSICIHMYTPRNAIEYLGHCGFAI